MSSFHRSSIRLRSKLRTALSTGLPNIRYSMRSCIINQPIRFPSRSMKRSRGAVGSSSITRMLLCERSTDSRCTSVSTHLNEMSRRPIPDQFAFVTHGLLGTHASESMSAWSLKHLCSARPTSPNRLAILSSRWHDDIQTSQPSPTYNLSAQGILVTSRCGGRRRLLHRQ